MRSRSFPILLVLFFSSYASAQTVNPGRVNVVTTPWSVNWLTHNADGPALTDLGYSAWEQTLIGSADLEAWIIAAGAGTGTVNLDVATALQLNWALDVRWYGAIGDGVRAANGVATAADATFTSATMTWAAGDVGKSIYVVGAGVAGALLRTTIAAINSPTSIELTVAASTSVNPAEFAYGTDNTAALETAFDARTDGEMIYIPHGVYLHTGLTINRVGAVGGGGEVALKGAGGPHWWDAHNTVLWCMDPDADVLTSEANTTIVDGITFRSVDDDPTYLGNGLVLDHASGVNGCQVRNCWFQILGQTGIVIGKADMTNIDNSTIELCETGVTSAVTSTNTTIHNSRIWGPTYGAILNSASDNSTHVIEGCMFAYGGISVTGPSRLAIRDNTIRMMTTVGNRPAISLDGQDYSQVTGNLVFNVSAHGIISTDGSYNNISGNTLLMNQGKFGDYDGIHLAGTEKDTIVADNQVQFLGTDYYGARFGLYTEATTTNIVIGANRLQGWEAPTMVLGTTRGSDAGPMTVRDGDIIVYDDTDVGAELLRDGDFATDPAVSGWTLGAGWSWDSVNFEVDHAGGGGTATLSFSPTIRAGHWYRLNFTIRNYSGTNTACVLARVGNSYVQWCDGNGTFSHIIRATNTAGLTFTPVTGFDGSIDDVSLMEVIGGDVRAAGLGHFAQVIQDVNNIAADVATFDTHGTHIVNSSGGAIAATLADGTTIGQTVRFVCKVAGNNIDITVSHHVTSDPEVIRLDTAKEWIELVWDGTDWVEASGNGQTYP